MNYPEVQLLENILAGLTGDQDSFRVDRRLDQKGVLLSTYVKQEQLGFVIGKGGENAKAIRTILRTLGGRNKAYYSVIINELEP